VQDADAIGGNAIGLATLFAGKRLDPALLLEASDRAVECSRSEARAAEANDVFDHGVAVFGTIGEAGEDHQRRVGKVAGIWVVLYYATSSTHHVVVISWTSGFGKHDLANPGAKMGNMERDSMSRFGVGLKGSAALFVAAGVVAVLLVMLPAYRWFFVISVLIGVVIAGGLALWNRTHPIEEQDVDTKRPLGL
jgi:hypothetical protein